MFKKLLWQRVPCVDILKITLSIRIIIIINTTSVDVFDYFFQQKNYATIGFK